MSDEFDQLDDLRKAARNLCKAAQRLQTALILERRIPAAEALLAKKVNDLRELLEEQGL